jgi:hypothetical protein
MIKFKLIKFFIIFLVLASCKDKCECSCPMTEEQIGDLQRKLYLAEVNLELSKKENDVLTEENQILTSFLGELESDSACSKALYELQKQLK